MLTSGSLFSGAGMLDRAIEDVLGARTLWFSQYEPPSKQNPKPSQAPSKVLEAHWPGVPNLGDITAINWATVPRVDVLSGGFPCQDLSLAGGRAGMKEGTRSGLWSRMLAAIDHLRPGLVVIENVRGLASACAHSDLEPCPRCVGGAGPHRPVLRALGRVLGDLADVGYDAAWCGLRAADVGAPHGRFRIFVLAWPVDAAPDAERGGRVGRSPVEVGGSWGGTAAADADRDGREGVGRLDAVRCDPDGRGRADVAWGVYESAVRRWEQLTRPAPAPTELAPKGGQRLSPAFVEWMQGWPAGWVSGVPGVSRNDALRICGNGVVPQQAAEALRRLLAVRASVLGRAA